MCLEAWFTTAWSMTDLDLVILPRPNNRGQDEFSLFCPQTWRPQAQYVAAARSEKCIIVLGRYQLNRTKLLPVCRFYWSCSWCDIHGQLGHMIFQKWVRNINIRLVFPDCRLAFHGEKTPKPTFVHSCYHAVGIHDQVMLTTQVTL
jgi:hypothetical protein